MTAFNDRFWAKVLFKEFIKHYRKLSDEQKVSDINESMDALEDLDDTGSSFGAKMVRWSMQRADEPSAVASRENGKKGGRPRKNPQDAPNGNAGVDRKSATSCDTFTADGDTREDSLNIPDGSNAGMMESGTSANIYGDAATREGAEDCHHPINGTIAHPTTVSKNMRRVPQNEAPAHGFSGGRTAQGTMSRSPEAAAQSGKAYDQETTGISANGRRTGGPSLSQTSSLPPVRQSEPDVMSLAYSGEFGNVRLTQAQYAELGIKFGNQQKLNRAIDSLSCMLENNELKPAPRSHYAVIVKWANYRDDMEEKEELKASTAPHYETVSEHNARIVRESDAWIHEYCQQQKKNRKAANG